MFSRSNYNFVKFKICVEINGKSIYIYTVHFVACHGMPPYCDLLTGVVVTQRPPGGSGDGNSLSNPTLILYK